MGLFDWLVDDPSQPGGGLLSRALGLNSPGQNMTTPTTPTQSPYSGLLAPYYSGGSLLGNSPLIQLLRGGAAGLAGGTGYTGGAAFGAGFTSAEQDAQRRRQWDLQNRLGGLDLMRQQMLLSGPPGMVGAPGVSSTPGAVPQDVRSIGPAGGYLPTVPKSGIDPTLQGGQPESTWVSPPNSPGNLSAAVGPNPYAPGTSPGNLAGSVGPNPMVPPNSPGNFSNPPAGGVNAPAIGGGNAAFKAATGFESPQQMYQYGQFRMYAGDTAGGKTYMDEALQYDSGLQAQSALLKSQNTITEGRSGSQPLLNGQPIGPGVPTLQQLTDQRSGQKYFARVYPNGDVVPLTLGGIGSGTIPGNTANAPLPGGNNSGGALPPALWTAQQYVESHFDPKAISPKGATGPAQFTPDTAKQYGGNSTQAQQAYMGDLYQKYGSLPIALAAYNWGPGNTDMWLKSGADPQKLPLETQNYISKVLDLTGQAGGFGNGSGGGQFANSASVGTNPGNGLAVSELGPAQQASLSERGKVLEDTVGTQIDQDAGAAKQNNFLLDQLKTESQGWGVGMGPFAPHLADMQKWAQQILPNNPELAQSVGNYQAFNKNAMEIVRAQVKNTSSRASTQEFQMIAQSLPSASMSRPAFDQIVTQLGAVNDFKLAKQAAASTWRQQHPTLEGFETDYNRNVSPAAFLALRLSDQDLTAMRSKLSMTKEGQATLAKLSGELSYLKASGLDQLGGN